MLSHNVISVRRHNSLNSLASYQASFSASGDRVFAFFKDHTIMAWALDGFAMTWKVELPGAPSAGLAPTPSEHENREQLMSMCAGRAIMAAASNETATGPSIFVWDVAEKALVHEITIPAFSAGGGVRQVQFVGKSTILAVLAGNGQVVFLDAAESRFVCRMPAAYKVGVAKQGHWA